MHAALLLRALAALAAVLALAVLAGRLARARLPAPAHGALRLHATLALDPRRRLHLVHTQSGDVLILTGGGSDQMLAWPMPPENEVNSERKSKG